jgi:hypothetical protein
MSKMGAVFDFGKDAQRLRLCLTATQEIGSVVGMRRPLIHCRFWATAYLREFD